jgi:hypothetical protein
LGVLPAAARRKGEETVERLLSEAYPEEKLQMYINKAIESFKKMGVSREALIKERGNRPPETWTRNDIVTLKSYGEDIASGNLAVGDVFKEETSPQDSLSAAMKNGNKKPEPPREAKPEEQKTSVEPNKCEAVLELMRLRDDPAYKNAIAAAIKQEMFTQHNMDSAIFNNKEKSAEAITEAIEIQQK